MTENNDIGYENEQAKSYVGDSPHIGSVGRPHTTSPDLCLYNGINWECVIKVEGLDHLESFLLVVFLFYLLLPF